MWQDEVCPALRFHSGTCVVGGILAGKDGNRGPVSHARIFARLLTGSLSLKIDLESESHLEMFLRLFVFYHEVIALN